MGLVEAGVGVVLAAAELKKLLRWQKVKILGRRSLANLDESWYGLTGSSPQPARFQYFLEGHDEAIMNRDRLLSRAIELVGEMQDDYVAPTPQ